MVVVVGDEGGGVGARRGEGRPARRGAARCGGRPVGPSLVGFK